MIKSENSIHERALVAPLESQLPKWWLHTDVDSWLWGKARPIKISRALIENNLSQFRRYGETGTAGATVSSETGGPLGPAYLLNYRQALLYCQISKAPRAADVREMLIRKFTNYSDGKLVPATSDAVVTGDSWARVENALTALTATVTATSATVHQRCVALSSGFRSDVGEINRLPDEANQRLAELDDRVAALEKRARRQVKRGGIG